MRAFLGLYTTRVWLKNKMNSEKIIAILCIYKMFSVSIADEKAINKFKDVYLVIIDDLRHLPDELDTLQIKNILNLAHNNVHFKNAFAQQALCAPSRNSMLTGRRPDRLQLYDFYSYWRDSVGNFTTIPQLFKEHGYNTHSVGKVFHPGPSSNFTDDYPYSWTDAPYHPPTLKYKDSPVCMNADGRRQANLVCAVDVSDQPGGTLPDIESLQHAISIISGRNRSLPLFLAVGFYKPHIPLKCPEEFLDLYPLDTIKTAQYDQRPYDMPLVAWHPWTDVRKRDDIASLNISFPFGILPDNWAKKIKQSYFSCMSYVDDLMGKLLLHIDKKNSIIVLVSDHGWSLGENGMWAKYANYDVDLRVPLIIQAPDIKRSEILDPVELIDIFPTLVDLAGLDVDIPQCSDTLNQITCFEGKSLLPLMTSTSTRRDLVAFSQYPRPSVFPLINSDKPKLKDIKIMGYSLRTNRFRYTEWVDFNSAVFTKNWSRIYGKELYDHTIDPNESLNLVNRKGLENLVEHFSFILREQFS